MKIIYLAFVAFILAACSQTPEQKAEALAKESIKKTLFKPDTYDPIETKLDSIVSPYNNPDFYEEVTQFAELLEEVPVLEHRIKAAKDKLIFYDGSFKNSFFKNEYQEAKERYEDVIKENNSLKKKIQKNFEKIAAELRGEHVFSGYAIAHSFRANTNDDNTVISHCVLFVDKNIENVIYALNEFEAKDFAWTIGQIKGKMEEGNQWFSDDGIE